MRSDVSPGATTAPADRHGRWLPGRLRTAPDLLRSRPWLIAVVVAGVAIRIALIRHTHGMDFAVVDKASAATLRGRDIYAHHPNYPAGPYAYFPLFLYLELPFRWLADRTGTAFTVWGQIPVLAGDLLTALLLARELDDRHCRPAVVAAGVAAFFLNPVVVMNSAIYGRFDTLACALLLAALRHARRTGSVTARSGVWFGLAVAAKTFPGFVVPGFLQAAGSARRRFTAAALLVLGALSLPYLGSVIPYLHDIVLYDLGKRPGALSWQQPLLHLAGTGGAKAVSYVLLVVFAAGAIRLSGRIHDLTTYTLLTLVLFLLCSKVVLPHYLVWPLPLLILAASPSTRSGRAAIPVAGVLTVIGLRVDPALHALSPSPSAARALLAFVLIGYLVLALADSRGEQSRPRDGTAGATAPTARPGAVHRTR